MPGDLATFTELPTLRAVWEDQVSRAALFLVSDLAAGDVLLPISTSLHELSGPPQIIDLAAKAQQRIAAIRASQPPWADFESGQEVPNGIFVAPAAESMVLTIFLRLTQLAPPSPVAIFPREDGGLRLQTVGRERTVIVDIPPVGTELEADYTGDDVYHVETLRSPDAAAQFIATSSR